MAAIMLSRRSFLLAFIFLASSAGSMALALESIPGTSTSNITDYLALISFKSLVRRDPSRALALWGNQSVPMCQWHGVACGLRGSRRGRVVALDLGELNLLGTISIALGNLTYMRQLNLSGNRFHGALPPELGDLYNLETLYLGYNSIEGQIPPSLSNCSNLVNISLINNNLQGEIPKYGLGNEVSTSGDIYSYGILLLEMFTGKRPTASEFGEAMGLRNHVQMALPDRVSTIMDQQLLTETKGGEACISNSSSIRDMRITCITSILQVGIWCSRETPMDRPPIGDVLKELLAIRDKFHTHLFGEGEPSVPEALGPFMA